MQISSRFTIAMHILTYIATAPAEEKVTSEILADSVQVNPVIIRNILSQLKKADLITVKRGQGGATIIKPFDQLSLFDVYRAVDSVKDGVLFSFHENPNPNCPVGRNIHNILDDKLLRVQQAMENELKAITLAEVLQDADKYLANK
ncbi:Rrf2 family transcriptional regulator [Ligilactobacillus murinus]|uniref:Rrf2 family transcriptional regulator n=1 Tax=Ligilactobacillus murinus TaxID=1622 RepID=A0A4Q2AK52_9LACO|nr:Rrf2 family transcriptional regulator [Ligilactobacillus murinus]NBH86225.1 Rrf2 family transcriptional regulator [Lachnospiraceae bacterium]HAP23887.1 Rrf2 family transcriptional regulator [Lactobacillus sp.]MBF0701174.1 Rrf2 family transcriptional regulator [Ligilactobacillus murinus]MBX9012182.1 Rrf2 family transcriptional regulator [Ligilactobacillus murinus]MCR1880694.1 Rrf2 family transcriptional regulator [Ligilactobacillus murinus]